VTAAQGLRTHRLILAGFSKFFSRVLKQQQHPHPLIYMRGMTAGQLSAVVDFIYHGEANIFQEDLDTFLALADELELKGLNGTETIKQDQTQPDVKPFQNQKRISNHSPGASPNIESPSNILQEMDQFLEPENCLETAMVLTDDTLKTQTNYEELDNTIDSMIEKNYEGNWVCKVCGKTENKKKANMKIHIEGKHIDGVSHPCNLCGKSFRSRPSLQVHTTNLHSRSRPSLQKHTSVYHRA
jgi:hypothetical protein